MNLPQSRQIPRDKKGGGAEARPGQWKEFPCRLLVEGEEIRVTAELPGVTEEMIRIDLEGRALTISADGREQHYRASIVLPWEAGLKGKRFRKGVLELLFGRPF